MPLKKRQKVKVTIQSDFIASLPEDASDSSTRPELLSDQQLARAYGLAPTRTCGDAQEDDFLPHCPPRWTKQARLAASTSKSKTPEVIEVDDTDDDLNMLKTSTKTPVSTSKKVVKGNGKGKEKESEPRVCSSENCGNNPKCLNWLGQDKWENSTKAWKDYRKTLGLPADPENDRIENTPVGLKNLGATCYVNSFLQVWYRDAHFRAGVYACEPPANGNVENSPLYQLQVLFAFLQSSKQAVYDPTPLVNSLKLDQTEQQDAQEFSKLFLSLLDHEFKKQGSKVEQDSASSNVGKLVQEQFEGTMNYGTRCHKCKHASERPASFLELEVSLTRGCALEARIAASLKDEQLTGDNKYHCENCDAKRDATRYSELQTLPPVLHFSLLRFTFNLKDLTRSKSQHAISYPLALDMGQYLPVNPQTGRRDKIWYDLRGVLMHKGVSAHHGHYVAQIFDEKQQKWFMFDDDAVSEIEDLNAPDAYDKEDDDDEVIIQKDKKKPTAGKSRYFGQEAELPKSKDAYMLVYTRRPDSAESKPAEPVLPPLAQFEVEKLDSDYKKEVDDWNAATGNAKDSFMKLREEKRSVYNSWDVATEEVQEEAFLVDKVALKRWVESDLVKDPINKTNGKGKEQEAVAEVQGGGAIVDSSGEGKMSEDTTTAGASTSNLGATSPAISTMPKDSPALSTAETAAPTTSAPKEDSLTPPASSEDGKNRSDQSNIDGTKTILNEAIVCEHGKANPAKAEQMKRVSQSAYDTLRELGVEVEPQLKTPGDFCRDCVAGMARECYYLSEHVALVEEVTSCINANVADSCCLLSKPWYTDWIKENPKMHSTSTGTDPSPASHPFIDDALCEHGDRAADTKKWMLIPLEAGRKLQEVFPDFELVDPDPCQACLGTHESDEAHLQESKEIQQKERKIIKSFDGQTRLGSNRLPLSTDDQAHYVVPRDWTKEWSKWSKPGKKDLQARPEALSNASFLCSHSLLCIDLPKEVETAKTITIATKEEWKYLVKAYEAGPEIRVWIEQGETEPRSRPEVCQECLEDRRKNFVTTSLWIRTLQNSALDKKGQRRADSPPVVTKAPPSKTKTASGQSIKNFYGSSSDSKATARGTRVSARNANKAGIWNRKDLKSIQMDKSDKVKDLKPKIEEATGIPIIAQRLFYNLQELDGSQSVEDLGLIGDDTIEVYEVTLDADFDLSDLQDVEPGQAGRPDSAKKTGSGKKRAREEGFGGTGLFGWDRSQEDRPGGENGKEQSKSVGTSLEDESGSSRGGKRSRSTSQAVSVMQIDDDLDFEEDTQIPCPVCTYLNNPALEDCEICNSALCG